MKHIIAVDDVLYSQHLSPPVYYYCKENFHVGRCSELNYWFSGTEGKVISVFFHLKCTNHSKTSDQDMFH